MRGASLIRTESVHAALTQCMGDGQVSEVNSEPKRGWITHVHYEQTVRRHKNQPSLRRLNSTHFISLPSLTQLNSVSLALESTKLNSLRLTLDSTKFNSLHLALKSTKLNSVYIAIKSTSSSNSTSYSNSIHLVLESTKLNSFHLADESTKVDAALGSSRSRVY